MNASPLPPNETERLAAVRSYNILDTLPEADYDAITKLAAYICQTPVAIVSLVDEDRQWFKSHHGLEQNETSRDIAFCAENILDASGPLVIEDARLDERFATNPLVTGEPNIVFYAGVPLVNSQGYALGSLCVIDSQPRQLSEEQLSALGLLSKQVMRLLELRKANDRLLANERQSSRVSSEKETTRVALAESETRFRSLVHEAPIAMLVYEGPDMVLSEANPLMLQILGRGEEILGKPLMEAVPELRETAVLERYRNVLATGETYQQNGERILLVKNGEPYWGYYDYTYKGLYDEKGEIYGVVCTAVEVTSQIVSQQALAASEARFREMVQKAPVAMMVLRDKNLTIEVANDAMLALLGRDASIIGEPALDGIPELETQPIWKIVSEVYESGEPYFADELPVKFEKNGQPHKGYYTFNCLPLNEAGETVGVLQVAVDMTNQVLARRKLQESETRYRELAVKLEAHVATRTQQLVTANQDLVRSNDGLQQFAYIASHDLQEPLRKIQSFSSMLRNKYGKKLGEDGLGYLDRMHSASGRMSTLIKDLLTYSQISTRQQRYGMVALNEVVSDSLTTLEWQIEERKAKVVVAKLPTIEGDASQLRQLFQNLLSNALKFTPAGENPQLRVAYTPCTRADLPDKMNPNSSATQFHKIDIKDQGVGFDTQYLDRIFQVFQRLHGKSEFPGTGIGLAICQRVVENHGGGITATSEDGQGATFVVYLPSEIA